MIDTTNMGIMANMIQPTSNIMSSHMISKKDTDSDSSLSIEEMGINQDLFSSYDTDSNSLISQSELTAAIDGAMSKLDGNIPNKEEFQSILSDFGFEVPNNTSNTLSTSQLDTISSVLENYDANNLTQSDAQEIVKAFQEAGIKPSEELANAMEDAGFDAREVGELAGVIGQGQGPGQIGATGGPPPGGGGGGAPSSSDSDEDYDVMDLNQDGVVSFSEMEEYYGLNSTSSSSESSEELTSNEQNALDNLQLLMRTLKLNNENSSIDTNNFDGLLKAINNQNNNSEINTYIQNSSSSSMFGYA